MTVVVKIGGARAVEPEGALADVADVEAAGTDVAVVHGGSTAVDDALERMGIAPEYVETPSGVVGRFTDEETMDVFKMALAGRVNTDLVTGLRARGVDAVGLSGVDGGLLHRVAQVRDPGRRGRDKEDPSWRSLRDWPASTAIPTTPRRSSIASTLPRRTRN